MPNLFQPLPDLVSLSAWYTKGDGNLELKLHVDATFGVAHFGEDPPAIVSFKVRLNAATMVVFVPEHEPIKIVASSVSLDNDTGSIERSLKLAERASSSGEVEGAAKLSTKKLGLSLKGKKKDSASSDKDKLLELKRKGAIISVVHRNEDISSHRWDLTAPAEIGLFGKPWDAHKSPRLSLERAKAPKINELQPTTVIEVFCRRQDIFPYAIKLNDKVEYKRLARAKAFANREAAAVCAVREFLLGSALSTSTGGALARIPLAAYPCSEVSK